MKYSIKSPKDKILRDLGYKLDASFLKGEFNYTFNLKEIFYYLFGAFSLFFTIYLGIGWLIECAITGDVFLYHITYGSDTIKFGYPGIGVIFVLPIALFVAGIYARLTAFYIAFWIVHTLYFFKILNRKIDLKYNYTPNIFLSIFLWICIVISAIFATLFLGATIATFDYFAKQSFNLKLLELGLLISSLICFFTAWFLKRTGIKWLWLILILCVTYIPICIRIIS